MTWQQSEPSARMSLQSDPFFPVHSESSSNSPVSSERDGPSSTTTANHDDFDLSEPLFFVPLTNPRRTSVATASNIASSFSRSSTAPERYPPPYPDQHQHQHQHRPLSPLKRAHSTPLQPPVPSISDADFLSLLSTPPCTPLARHLISHLISQPPFLPLPGALNMRSLASPPHLRPNLLFRSGALGGLTSAARAALRFDWDITTVFDLRSSSERKRAPSPSLNGITTIWEPCAADGSYPSVLECQASRFAGGRESAAFTAMYNRLLVLYAPTFRRVFQELLDGGEGGILFHCTAGKDRTGVLAALLLEFAGAQRDYIATDYALSRIGMEPAREALVAIAEREIGEKLSDACSGDKETDEKKAGMAEMLTSRYEVMMSWLDHLSAVEFEADRHGMELCDGAADMQGPGSIFEQLARFNTATTAPGSDSGSSRKGAKSRDAAKCSVLGRFFCPVASPQQQLGTTDNKMADDETQRMKIQEALAVERKGREKIKGVEGYVRNVLGFSEEEVSRIRGNMRSKKAGGSPPAKKVDVGVRNDWKEKEKVMEMDEIEDVDMDAETTASKKSSVKNKVRDWIVVKPLTGPEREAKREARRKARAEGRGTRGYKK